MKKIIILSTLLILSKANFAQQFSFNKLIEMTSSLKTFEIEMIKTLNHMVEKTTVLSYSYQTEAGGLGSSRNLPTNNSKYEPKYKFEDGLIYSLSEIEKLHIDDTYEKRNLALKQGLLLNKAVADSFDFHASKLISLIKSESTRSGFAENYNFEKETAATWYSWENHKYTKILASSKLFEPSHKKLTIQYVRDADFSKILNQLFQPFPHFSCNFLLTLLIY